MSFYVGHIFLPGAAIFGDSPRIIFRKVRWVTFLSFQALSRFPVLHSTKSCPHLWWATCWRPGQRLDGPHTPSLKILNKCNISVSNLVRYGHADSHVYFFLPSQGSYLHWVNGSLDYLAYTRLGSSVCVCRAWHAASSVERIVQLLEYPLLWSHHTFILLVPGYLSSVPWLLVLHESVWMIWVWQSYRPMFHSYFLISFFFSFFLAWSMVLNFPSGILSLIIFYFWQLILLHTIARMIGWLRTCKISIHA